MAPALELEPPFEPTEYVSVEEQAWRAESATSSELSESEADPFAAPTPEELARRELIEAQERETVRDVALVRTAAALAADRQASL